jgi:basic amino acid/polyamine antiporter, APA family
MTLVRSIGRWTMTALVINTTIGTGIFGLPAELTRLLGRASPLAMILGALGVGVIMACFAEVASQFSESGGPYLYVRTAFGRFLRMQIGWFHLLIDMVGVATCAALFVNYLSRFLPWQLNTWQRALLLAIVIAIPTVANCLGVRSGAMLSNIMTVAKVSPLAVLILFGITTFARHPQMIQEADIISPGLSKWVRATAFLLFVFAGPEGALVPSGEIKEPRRTIPFSLAAGILGCAVIFTLVQFITVATVGTKPSDQPLADAASVLLGIGGAAFVSIAVMISAYGWISGVLLYGPRLAFAMAANRDCPGFLAALHPRFHTPVVAILLYACAAWTLASTRTYLWIVTISSGGIAIYYPGTCAALIRLRMLRPNVEALRIPLGPLLSIVGIAISVGAIAGLNSCELLALNIPAIIATGDWRENVATKIRSEVASSSSIKFLDFACTGIRSRAAI